MTRRQWLLSLLRANPLMSRAEAEWWLGEKVGWQEWRDAHVAYYRSIGRRDLVRTAKPWRAR